MLNFGYNSYINTKKLNIGILNNLIKIKIF